MPGTLSVVMITKNEADRIADALESVKWADEIIVVDCGSTDDTVKIAESYGATTFHQDWLGFGPQRQVAQSKATNDWILMMDADERATPELKEEILAILEENDQTKAYQISRLTYVFGHVLHHVWHPDFGMHLYPKAHVHFNDAQLHEDVVIAPHIKVCRLKGEIEHHTYRNLRHFIEKSMQFAEIWIEQKYKQNTKAKWTDLFTHSTSCFIKHYIIQKGFLDGEVGFIISALSAYASFIKYAMLWEKTRSSLPKD